MTTPALAIDFEIAPHHWDAVLCYVDGGVAYFTTKKLSEQWGDDWNDAPYEHNAGTPYEASRHFLRSQGKDKPLLPCSDWTDGKPNWEIVSVRFVAPDMLEPCECHCNSPYSVEQINRGDIPWLRPDPIRCNPKPMPSINAGVSLRVFCQLLSEAGGYLTVPAKLVESNWGQGQTLVYGRYCAITATDSSCRADIGLANRSLLLLCKAAGIDNAVNAIIIWNDAPGRTQAEVLEAFDAAIDLARKEESDVK